MAMKTAVSIPDGIFQRAENALRGLGMSRSRLYATALQEYLDRHSELDVVERLNDVHGRLQEVLDPLLQEIQARSLPREPG